MCSRFRVVLNQIVRCQLEIRFASKTSLAIHLPVSVVCSTRAMYSCTAERVGRYQCPFLQAYKTELSMDGMAVLSLMLFFRLAQVLHSPMTRLSGLTEGDLRTVDRCEDDLDVDIAEGRRRNAARQELHLYGSSGFQPGSWYARLRSHVTLQGSPND